MSQQTRVLWMLKHAGERGVTSSEFLDAHIPCFSARIRELRMEGHEITSERISKERHTFTFRLEPDVERGRGEHTADARNAPAPDGGSGSTPSCSTASLGARRRPRAATQHPSDDSSVGERGRPTPLQEEMFPDPRPSAYREAA